MAKTPTALDDSLNRAAQSVSNLVLQHALRELPNSMTIGELIDSMSATDYNGHFRSMSLNAFLDARGGGSAKSASSDERFNTRTQAGREEMDALISSFIEREGTAGAEMIREGIGGGSSAQIRESVTRLMDQGLVTKSGEKRGTKYSWKAKAAKKGK